MEKKRLARGLEDLSRVFLSTSEEPRENKMPDEFPAADRNGEGSSHLPDEMEETVTVRRRIAYHDNDKVEENMRRAVSEHLKQGYRLKRVELQRKEDMGEPKSRVRKDEEITIFVKARPPT